MGRVASIPIIASGTDVLPDGSAASAPLAVSFGDAATTELVFSSDYTVVPVNSALPVDGTTSVPV